MAHKKFSGPMQFEFMSPASGLLASIAKRMPPNDRVMAKVPGHRGPISRFSDDLVLSIIRDADNGVPIRALADRLSVDERTVRQWVEGKTRYRLRMQVDSENRETFPVKPRGAIP